MKLISVARQQRGQSVLLKRSSSDWARVLALTLVGILASSAGFEQSSSAEEAGGLAAEMESLDETLGIVYADYGERKLHLDLWRPRGAEGPLPGLIVVHGGGWLKGDKSKFHRLGRALAERGYVTVAIEYRLGGEAKFPAAVQDCNTAVRWLRAHAAEYGVDADKIGAVGGSAGGHLVGLMATAPENDVLEGKAFQGKGSREVSGQIQAAVVMAGPWQLATGPVAEKSRQQPDASNANRWLGKTIDEAPDLYRLASPYTHIDAQSAPTLFMTGEFDQPSRNLESRDKLRQHNVLTGILVYEGGKHGCWNREPWLKRMVIDMDAFFSEVFDRQPAEAPLVIRDRQPWGTLSQQPRQLVLNLGPVSATPTKISVPRMYTPVGEVTSVGKDGARTTIALKPEPSEWLLSIPADCVEVRVPTKVSFCDWTLSPIVSQYPGAASQPNDAEAAEPGSQSESREGDEATGPAASTPTIRLAAHDARTQGKMLRYEPQPHKNCVGYWVNSEDTCHWRFYVEEPGTYEIVVSQGCGKGQGGSQVELRVGDQKVPFVVEDTGHFQNFKDRTVGSVRFDKPGVYDLQLGCVMKARNAVMDVRQIVLTLTEETPEDSSR